MVLAAAAAFTGASVQSATGFGFALVLSPALFAVMEPFEAVWALLVLGVVLNLLVLCQQGRVRWDALRPVLIASLPGLAVGAALLAIAPKPVLQVVVGIGVVGAAFLTWRAPEPEAASGTGGAVTAGLASGALTTSVSLSGPPLVLRFRARGLTPAEMRASLAAAFLFLNIVGAVLLFAVGEDFDAFQPEVLAPLLALVVAGHLLGSWLFRRVDAELLSAMVLALVVAGGLASVAAGLAAA